MGDRLRKRAWLRLVGTVGDDEACGSAPLQSITKSAIDSTLGAIQGDDIWVALACLDAASTNDEILSNATVLHHLLSLGLRHTQMDNFQKALDLKSKQTLYKLSIRRLLFQLQRMLDVWEAVYGLKPHAAQSSEQNDKVEGIDDETGSFDAWDESGETRMFASSKASSDLPRFLKSTPLHHAEELAASCQALTLQKFIKALPTSLFSPLFAKRLDIIRQLLLSMASAKANLGTLIPLRLLPGVTTGMGSDVWTDREKLAGKDDDITDDEDVYEALQNEGLLSSADLDRSSASARSLEEGEIANTSLLRFYHDYLEELGSRVECLSASTQLSSLLSEGFTSPLDQGLDRTSEDLSLLQPLLHSHSSSLRCSMWTLRKFREEMLSVSNMQQRQALALLYVEGAKSGSEAIEGAIEGALPYLRTLTRRYGHELDEGIGVEEAICSGFREMLLALADKGRFDLVTYLSEGSAQLNIAFSSEEKGRVILACLLGSSKFEQTDHRQLQQLSLAALPPKSQAESTTSVLSLKDCISAVAQHLDKGPTMRPSHVFRFLYRLDGNSLRSHIQRCQAYLDTCVGLVEWNERLTPIRLALMQGEHQEQESCITYVFGTFGRGSKTAGQWQIVLDLVEDSIGPNASFNVMQTKDVARIGVESALRMGDTRTYANIFAQYAGRHLSHEELEEILLNASRTFYDNATSANVHQGDMKIAHEILLQYNAPTTQRIEREKAFIEASSRLCSFHIQSDLQPGLPLSPIEIRLSKDRLTFIKRLLESRDEAYKTPDLILDVAQKLCAVPGGASEPVSHISSSKLPNRAVVESKTLALLTEAALGQGDYTQAQVACERLVSCVTKFSKRAEQSVANQGPHHEKMEDSLRQVKESAYRTCFLLSKQPDWTDYASRLKWASHVLAYCPDEQLERYVQAWRTLEHQYQEDLLANPPKDFEQLAVQLKPGQGGLASSLSSMGSLGTFDSFSPFSVLFSSARIPTLGAAAKAGSSNAFASTQSRRGGAGRAPSRGNVGGGPSPREGSPSSRAARLFDSLGAGPSGTGEGGSNMSYLDPAERAARAARRFFGGFGA